MSYLVLARKYRPTTFDEVVGQEHITQALRSAISSGKVAHAFLFSGPRGVGKTTCARILAKEINQAMPQQAGVLEFDSANLDIIEIDGASNRGIDEARAIRDNAMFMSMSGGYKFYIIDEVHMLTEPAFNALLKTLEEPPQHVKFIFATTDPEKVPTTIRSRCQHFHFKRLSMDAIQSQLKAICRIEKLSIEDEALFAIARAAQGGMRDALGILDQLTAGDKLVTLDRANRLLGLIDIKHVFDAAHALINKDASGAMACLEAVINAGKDERQFLRDIVEHFRNIMIMKINPEKLQSLVDYPVFYRKQLLEQANLLPMKDILKVMDILILSKDAGRLTNAPRMALELAMMQAIIALSVGIPEVAAPMAASVLPPPTQSRPSAASAPVVALSSHGPLTLPGIKNLWHDLTAAVQAQKTYLGTYLLEGAPVSVNGQTLTIAFSKDFLYHKECLEEPAAIKLVADIFSAVLKQPVLLSFALADVVARERPVNLQNALDTLEGEVVNEWHNT